MIIASKKSHRKKRNILASKSRTINNTKHKAKQKKNKHKISEKNRKFKPLKTLKKRIVRNEIRSKKEKAKANKLAKEIHNFFGEKFIEQVGRMSGFLIRKAKIIPHAFLIAVAFGTFGYGEKSQAGIATTLLVWFNIKVSAQAISKRLAEKKTVKFFRLILLDALSFQLKLACKNDYATLFKSFRGVKIEDSSKIELHEHVKGKFKGSGGGASKSAMKVNYCFDITENSATHIDIVSGIKPDQALAGDIVKNMKKGELLIRDLGYFSLEAMARLIKKAVFFLSRANNQTHYYLNQDDEQPMNLNEFLGKELTKNEYIDCELYVGKLMRMKIRLLAEKVPEEVKNQRASRYKKERKKQPSEDYIVWSGFSVFITNIPMEMWSPKILILAYKLRWQIELFFKSIKSRLKIDVMKGEKEEVVHCMIQAKLISILVALPVVSYLASICEEDEELSVDKTIKWLHEDNRLGTAIAKGILPRMIKTMLSDFHVLCKDKRTKDPSTYKDIITAIEEELEQSAA